MIEDDFYRTSSQYRLWSFTAASLQAQRATTNAVASDRVRAAIRRAQEARRSATSSATGTPVPEVEGSTSTNHPAKAEEKPIECLTPEEEQQTVSYYCEQIIQLGEAYKPPLPTIVRATAIQYLRRFYLTNSPMTYHPKQIMPCVLFLATKTDNYYMSLRHFADGVPGDTTAEDIIAPEFVVMQSLRFTFDVRHPFRGLEGGIMELQALAAGQGQPAPHLAATQTQTPESLQRGLLALPPSSSSSSSKNITDRIARAHHATREILKSAAQITDVYFLFTPAQIWLAALMLADRPLAEYYLDTKLGPPSSQEAEANMLATLRPKLLRTLNDCAAMLQAYKPLASDPDQMKTLRRIIGKKLYHCQNPEKVSLGAGQKRIPAAAIASSAAAAVATPTGGVDSGASESEMERLAKKRKLETAAESSSGSKNIFGGELVMQRTKER